MHHFAIFAQRNGEHLGKVHTANRIAHQEARSRRRVRDREQAPLVPAVERFAANRTANGLMQAKAPRNDHHPEQKPDNASKKVHRLSANTEFVATSSYR